MKGFRFLNLTWVALFLSTFIQVVPRFSISKNCANFVPVTVLDNLDLNSGHELGVCSVWWYMYFSTPSTSGVWTVTLMWSVETKNLWCHFEVSSLWIAASPLCSTTFMQLFWNSSLQVVPGVVSVVLVGASYELAIFFFPGLHDPLQFLLWWDQCRPACCSSCLPKVSREFLFKLSALHVSGYAHGAGVQSNMTLSHDFICLYHHSYLR